MQETIAWQRANPPAPIRVKSNLITPLKMSCSQSLKQPGA